MVTKDFEMDGLEFEFDQLGYDLRTNRDTTNWIVFSFDNPYRDGDGSPLRLREGQVFAPATYSRDQIAKLYLEQRAYREENEQNY